MKSRSRAAGLAVVVALAAVGGVWADARSGGPIELRVSEGGMPGTVHVEAYLPPEDCPADKSAGPRYTCTFGDGGLAYQQPHPEILSTADSIQDPPEPAPSRAATPSPAAAKEPPPPCCLLFAHDYRSAGTFEVALYRGTPDQVKGGLAPVARGKAVVAEANTSTADYELIAESAGLDVTVTLPMGVGGALSPWTLAWGDGATEAGPPAGIAPENHTRKVLKHRYAQAGTYELAFTESIEDARLNGKVQRRSLTLPGTWSPTPRVTLKPDQASYRPGDSADLQWEASGATMVKFKETPDRARLALPTGQLMLADRATAAELKPGTYTVTIVSSSGAGTAEATATFTVGGKRPPLTFRYDRIEEGLVFMQYAEVPADSAVMLAAHPKGPVVELPSIHGSPLHIGGSFKERGRLPEALAPGQYTLRVLEAETGKLLAESQPFGVKKGDARPAPKHDEE